MFVFPHSFYEKQLCSALPTEVLLALVNLLIVLCVFEYVNVSLRTFSSKFSTVLICNKEIICFIVHIVYYLFSMRRRWLYLKTIDILYQLKTELERLYSTSIVKWGNSKCNTFEKLTIKTHAMLKVISTIGKLTKKVRKRNNVHSQLRILNHLSKNSKVSFSSSLVRILV